MPKTAPTLDELEAEAQTAIAQAAQAKQAADQARAVEAQHRAERLDAYDRHDLTRFSLAQLSADVDQARQQLADAMRGDRVWLAVTDLIAAQLRRRELWSEASSVSARTGGAAFTQPPGTADPPGFDTLTAIAAREARARVNAELDQRAQARDDAGTGTGTTSERTGS